MVLPNEGDKTQDNSTGERKATVCRPVWRREGYNAERNTELNSKLVRANEYFLHLPASKCYVNALNL